MIEIRRYVTRDGRDVVGEWLTSLEAHAFARVSTRIDRLSLGNFGDSKWLREGVSELRVDWGQAIVCTMLGRTCVLLLCGGDKRKQASDIERAVRHLEDYKERTRMR